MKVPTPAYRCALARLQPDPRPDPEQIKREGWRDHARRLAGPIGSQLRVCFPLQSQHPQSTTATSAGWST